MEVFGCFIDRFFEIADFDLGVDLGCVEAAVPKQFLDMADARAVF